MKGLRDFLLLLVFADVVLACEFDFWVFDSYEQDLEFPSETATLIADGECRGIGLGSRLNFPGYYRATCRGDAILFSVSGCTDSNCQECPFDPLDAKTLFVNAENCPVKAHPKGKGFAMYQCYGARGNESSEVVFAVYGECSRCPWPTARPVTAFPTRSPIRSPVSPRPTHKPTRNPTYAPTPWPTYKPTSRPTSTPTRVPVSASPTSCPIHQPSFQPVRAPITPLPTRAPSRKPSRAPSPKPTNSPSRRPTEQPISSLPTRLPIMTWPPVFAISFRLPVTQPTPSPTATPTQFPTLSPVVTPTEFPTVSPTDVFPSRVTASFAEIYNTAAGEELVEEIFSPASTQFPAPSSISTAIPDTQENLASPTLSSKPEAPVDPETNITVTTVSKSRSVFVVGYSLAIAGGLSLVAVGVAIFAILQRRNRLEDDKDGSNSKVDNSDSNKSTDPATDSSPDVFVVVDDSSRDEMSTLGGYTLKAKDESIDGSVCDDPTVSVEMGYDFERHVHKGLSTGQNNCQTSACTSAEFSHESTLERLGESLFNDDTSFEQQFAECKAVPDMANETFEVPVPPGPIGIVVDSAVGGLPPIVRSLGTSSVLREKVLIGDRLLAVATEGTTHDVTHLSARAVSNVILKAAHQKRVLRFARSDNE